MIDIINGSGLKDVMRNISFQLNIDVVDVPSPTVHVKETLESIVAGPIRKLTNSRYNLPEWVECRVDERKQIGFIGNSITLKNVRHTADHRIATVTRRTYSSKHKKNYFTVEELVDILVRFERLDRPKSCILNDGRIDRGNIFLGLHKESSSCYSVRWI